MWFIDVVYHHDYVPYFVVSFSAATKIEFPPLTFVDAVIVSLPLPLLPMVMVMTTVLSWISVRMVMVMVMVCVVMISVTMETMVFDVVALSLCRLRPTTSMPASLSFSFSSRCCLEHCFVDVFVFVFDSSSCLLSRCTISNETVRHRGEND